MAALDARRRRSACPIVLTVLVALGAEMLTAQSFQDPFREGMASFDQRRWAEAAAQFQRAAQIRPDTGERVRLYGVRFENYVPLFFLGRALFQMGDFQGAVRAFDAAEQNGAVRATRYYQSLQELRGEARGRLPITITSTTTTTMIPAAPPTSTPTSTPAPSSIPLQVAPDQFLKAANQAIGQARAAREAFEHTRDLDEVRRIQADIARAERQARADLDGASQRLESGLRGTANDREVLALAQAATSGFEHARKLAEDTRQRALADLVAATTFYFQGRYGAARTELGKLNYTTGFPAVQIRLFRAAAAHALFVTGGEQNQRLRQEAESHVRECKRLAAAGFRPDPRAFSPRFLAFFASVS